MTTVLHQPIAVPPGAGRELKSLGVTHKLTSAETGGAYYLCQAIFAPERGSPMHIHRNEDEIIYVLEGVIDIRLDKDKLSVPAGGIVHLPKKTPHSLYNPSKTLLKLMVYAIPGGLEHYFDEVNAALENGTFDAETHANISKKYGLKWLQ
jgi:mannose-6-phosphate isomerase-like protein (cupin superfamily)